MAAWLFDRTVESVYHPESTSQHDWVFCEWFLFIEPWVCLLFLITLKISRMFSIPYHPLDISTTSTHITLILTLVSINRFSLPTSRLTLSAFYIYNTNRIALNTGNIRTPNTACGCRLRFPECCVILFPASEIVLSSWYRLCVLWLCNIFYFNIIFLFFFFIFFFH